MSRTGNFFIVMRTDLAEDPAVIQLAERLKTREENVVGYLHSVWGWFSQHTTDGSVRGVSLDALGRRLRLDNFPQLMESVGWLKEYKGDDGVPILTIPNHDRWFGGREARQQYERDRKREQRRQNRQASKSVPDIVPDNGGTLCGRFAPTETETETETETTQVIHKGEDLHTISEKLLDTWEKTPGVKPLVSRGLTDQRSAELAKRLGERVGDRSWWEAWQDVMGRMPFRCGFEPTLDQALAPDFVVQALEGKWDFSVGRGGNHKPQCRIPDGLPVEDDA